MYKVENNVANVIALNYLAKFASIFDLYMPVCKGTRFHLIDLMEC